MMTDAFLMVGGLFATFVLGALFGAWVAESGRKAEIKAERARRQTATVRPLPTADVIVGRTSPEELLSRADSTREWRA